MLRCCWETRTQQLISPHWLVENKCRRPTFLFRAEGIQKTSLKIANQISVYIRKITISPSVQPYGGQDISHQCSRKQQDPQFHCLSSWICCLDPNVILLMLSLNKLILSKLFWDFAFACFNQQSCTDIAEGSVLDPLLRDGWMDGSLSVIIISLLERKTSSLIGTLISALPYSAYCHAPAVMLRQYGYGCLSFMEIQKWAEWNSCWTITICWPQFCWFREVLCCAVPVMVTGDKTMKCP